MATRRRAGTRHEEEGATAHLERLLDWTSHAAASLEHRLEHLEEGRHALEAQLCASRKRASLLAWALALGAAVGAWSLWKKR